MPNITANGIQIEYDTFGDPSSPPLLLIMGLGAQMIHWPEEFCNLLASEGLYVIRFDNRDVGLSSKFDEAGVYTFSNFERFFNIKMKVIGWEVGKGIFNALVKPRNIILSYMGSQGNL